MSLPRPLRRMVDWSHVISEIMGLGGYGLAEKASGTGGVINNKPIRTKNELCVDLFIHPPSSIS